MSVVLDVNVRENTGTGGARAVTVKYNEVLKAINTGQFLSNMIELSHDGKTQKVLTKDVQFHPVTDRPVHLDFYRVTAKSIIEVEVSVNFVGEDVAPGLKEGGTLNVVRYAIEVKCPAGSIPDNIEVDVSSMEIGDSIHISEVSLPEGVKPSITDRDFTIATVVVSRAAIEEEVEELEGEEGVEGEEGAEGEAPAAEGEGGEG